MRPYLLRHNGYKVSKHSKKAIFTHQIGLQANEYMREQLLN